MCTDANHNQPLKHHLKFCDSKPSLPLHPSIDHWAISKCLCRAQAKDGHALCWLDVTGCTAAGPPIHHLDLYRLKDASEAGRLDLGTLLQSGVAMIEWPERLGQQHLPADHLAIDLQSLPEVRHRAGALPVQISALHEQGCTHRCSI